LSIILTGPGTNGSSLTIATTEHHVDSQIAMKGVALDATVVGLKSAFACMLKKMRYSRLVGIGLEMV
jgi:hypothetical protein